MLSSEISQSPLLDLFNKGDVGELTRQLETAATLSADELNFLPKLLELLVAKHKENSPQASHARAEALQPVLKQELPLHNSNADIKTSAGNFNHKSAEETRLELAGDILGIGHKLNAAAIGDRPRLLLAYLQIQVAKTLGISAGTTRRTATPNRTRT